MPPLLRPVAWIASRIYAQGLRRHAAALQRSAPWSAPVPVISVGNVSAGGTGKSPMVRWICDELRRMGMHPAVVLRGHRGGESSDEVLEHRAAMPGTPVGVGADRRVAIERVLVMDPSVNAIVLDDGFQHRQVVRDLDLVLVDALRPAIDGALLPLGWLREPAEALRRADAVVVTRALRMDPALAELVHHLHGKSPAAWARHAWTGLRIAGAEAGEQASPLDRLRGRSVAIWAGIGNRAAFVEQVRACGARVVDVPALADHHAYGEREIARLTHAARGAGATEVVCTEKDWVKLRLLPRAGCLPFVRPELRIEFVEGEGALRELLVAAVARGNSRAGR